MADPIVFLPGLLCNHLVFRPQTEILSPNYPTFVTDLTHHASVADMARHVLVDAPASFTLVGMSMGGYVALELFRQAPSRIERLVLMDTSARADDDETRRRRRGLISLSRKGRFKGVTRQLLPRLIHPDRLTDVDLTETIMEMAAEIGREAYVRQQTAILQRPDSRPTLADIKCPTLVICGRQDLLTPFERSEEIAERIANAELHIIDRAGHLTALEQPDKVNRLLLDWLRRTEIWPQPGARYPDP
ncbi:MAG: alpha/beta hydrolase [Pseudomonadota bacterium]